VLTRSASTLDHSTRYGRRGVKITVNGEERQVADGLTVLALLELLAVPTRYVAVERNREIVPRGAHGETSLEAGDAIEIVTMVGGG